MKRLLDVALLVLGSPVWVPLLILVGTAVWLMMGRPIFFSQARAGMRGEAFRLVKFRTMLPPVPQSGRMPADADRLTRFGRWLRSTSLDELPELWNVLTGKMSLVGPRPLLMEYLPLYTPQQARRHAVRPGITGWAQVNGRNSLSWEEKFELDVWYVDNRTVGLDLRILLLTVWRVFSRDGVTPTDQEIMPRFTGAGTRPGTGRN